LTQAFLLVRDLFGLALTTRLALTPSSDKAIDRLSIGDACPATGLGGLEGGGSVGNLDARSDAFAFCDARSVCTEEHIPTPGGVYDWNVVHGHVSYAAPTLYIPAASLAGSHDTARPIVVSKRADHPLWLCFACYPFRCVNAHNEVIHLTYQLQSARRIFPFNGANHRDVAGVRQLDGAYASISSHVIDEQRPATSDQFIRHLLSSTANNPFGTKEDRTLTGGSIHDDDSRSCPIHRPPQQQPRRALIHPRLLARDHPSQLPAETRSQDVCSQPAKRSSFHFNSGDSPLTKDRAVCHLGTVRGL
jgi:hypothetical protein